MGGDEIQAVTISFEGARYEKRAGESVLDCLLRGGANISFSCRKGSCHTCVLQCREGALGPAEGPELSAAQNENGLFLPCTIRACGDLWVERPERGSWVERAMVQDVRKLSRDVYSLRLDVGLDCSWRPGQFINILGPEKTWRSYSVISLREDDYFLECLVKRWKDGLVSRFICDELSVGDEIEYQGPLGTCYYDPTLLEHPLLLIATGSGVGALWGIARDALQFGHAQPIHLYHGCRTAEDLCLHDRLTELAADHAHFHYYPCLSGETLPDVAHGRVTDVAFREYRDLRDYQLFFCGNPDVVQECRVRAIEAGASRARIRADAFDSGPLYRPDERALLAEISPSKTLWEALGQGVLLTQILGDFYDRAYADPQLSPFFHRVTKARAIEKQYEFLRDLISGTTDYFGARPFNAHHWMVISDELFDHREEMFFECVRRRGIDERLVWYWSAIHERFRRAIVKSAPRGLLVDGVESLREGFSEELLTMGMVCDGCQQEMEIGSVGRMHNRTGELFCEQCAARAMSVAPPRYSFSPPSR